MHYLVEIAIWRYLSLHWRGALGWIWLITGIYLAIRIILQRRAPAATLAWIMALCLMPPVGLLIHHFFGPRKIKRQSMRRLHGQTLLRAHNDLSALKLNPLSPPTAALQHSQLIQASCGLPPSSCESIELINGGGATLDALLQAIAQARCHVHLEYYIYDPDQTGTQLTHALIEALQRGVKVRLLVDAIGSAAFLGRRGKALRGQFAAAGGELAVFHPAWLDRWRLLVNLRTHRKIVVCDGAVGFTGGINISDTENEHLFPSTAYRDTHMRLQGAAVRWLQYVFLHDWVYASGKHDFEEEILGCAQPGPYAVQIVASGPDGSGQAIHHSMVHAINIAQHRIWLTTPYFVPTEPALFALKNAALRGVEVIVLVPKRSDSFWVTMAARSYFEPLRQAGAQVYEYVGTMLHAKTLVVDDNYSLVGTANFDNRSFLLNFELAVALYSPSLTKQLADMFEQDLKKAQKARPAGGKTVWYKKMAVSLCESLARLLSPLL